MKENNLENLLSSEMVSVFDSLVEGQQNKMRESYRGITELVLTLLGFVCLEVPHLCHVGVDSSSNTQQTRSANSQSGILHLPPGRSSLLG